MFHPVLVHLLEGLPLTRSHHSNHKVYTTLRQWQPTPNPTKTAALGLPVSIINDVEEVRTFLNLKTDCKTMLVIGPHRNEHQLLSGMFPPMELCTPTKPSKNSRQLFCPLELRQAGCDVYTPQFSRANEVDSQWQGELHHVLQHERQRRTT